MDNVSKYPEMYVKNHEMHPRMRQIMGAEQKPDVYGGENCDQIIPRWMGWADGDKDGEGDIGPEIKLSAKHFPPGTRIKIEIPVCPRCGEDADFGKDAETTNHVCQGLTNPFDGDREPCGFNWRAWAYLKFA